ncbi:MAG: LpqB family beta-propeller domain-containing protein [Micromonospora sp.]
MIRRVLAAALGGLLVTAGLAGCGIPDNTAVQVDGSGPAAESGSLNGGAVEPPTHTASKDPKQFILNYLAAAAGEPDQAYNRAKEFIAPAARAVLRERKGSDVAWTVVRLREEPEATPPNNDGTSVVTVKVQQVGVLRADGTLAPPVATETQYQFKLRPAPSTNDAQDPGLMIAELQNVLLLSDKALDTYYRTHTIYFWNSDQTQLVPDLRYLPSAVPAERLVTEVVKWLTDGPSDWLAPAVTRLPERTTPINNATGSDGRWEVNLAIPGVVSKDRLARLATQLAWSLGTQTGQLDLKIQNQNRLTVDLKQERESHPAYRIVGSPQRFCVYDGAIRPLSFGELSGTVPVAAADNKGVVSAALDRSGDDILAALVVAQADRGQRLMAGTGPAPVSLFNGGGRWFTSLGRPVWLRSLDPQRPYGLVVADGRLYRFDRSAVMYPVSLPVSGRVTAVAASLDGQRIALIIGGRLYVAVVNLDGGVVTVDQPRRLVTRLTDLSAVDWSGENKLVFAGVEGRPVFAGFEGRPAIYETTVDGGLDTALKRDIGAQVTHLAAYAGSSVGAVFMYEANKVAYRNTASNDVIKRDQVVGVTPPPGGKASNPTAPFFLY